MAAGPDELDRRDWEVVIDCTGVVAAIEDGLTRVARGGTFQVFGVAPAEASAPADSASANQSGEA